MKKLICCILAGVLSVFLIVSVTAASATDALSGKTALFLGDSIAAGWRDEVNGNYTNAGGWAKRIGDTYGMQATLAAIAGNSFTPIVNRGRIVDQVKKKAGYSYDYVILQGGFNDAMGENKKPADPATSAPVGEMAQGFTLADFDTSTYGGALEETLYYIKQYFPTARVGYIITYATPNSEYGGCTAYTAGMLQYYDLGKKICQKWGISYLDLFSGKTDDGLSYSYDILKVDTTVNFPGGSDHIHLNSHGYDTIYPYIAQWMTTIQPMGSTAKTTKSAATTTTAKTAATTTAKSTATESSYSASTSSAVALDSSTTNTVDSGKETAVDTGKTSALSNETATDGAVVPAANEAKSSTAKSGLNKTEKILLIVSISAAALVSGALVTVLLLRKKGVL